jgi:hypothetical protein
VVSEALSTVFYPVSERFPARHVDSPTVWLGGDGFKLIKELFALKGLEPGWDFGEGESISSKTLNKSIEVARLIIPHTLNTEVQPKHDGGVKFIVGANNEFLDIDIHPDLSLSLVKEVGFGFDYETVLELNDASLLDIKHYLSKLAAKYYLRCALQEPSILENTVHKREDFHQTAFATMAEPFPSSTMTAHVKRQETESAPTFHYITEEPYLTP